MSTEAIQTELQKHLSEVDLILHYMRHSNIGNVRNGLEQLAAMKKGNIKPLADIAHVALREIHLLFKDASNNAPLP